MMKLLFLESNLFRKLPCCMTISGCVAMLCGDSPAVSMQVKAGGACQTDMQEVHDLLTAATDSICVHSVGYTLTLFRWAELHLCNGIAHCQLGRCVV